MDLSNRYSLSVWSVIMKALSDGLKTNMLIMLMWTLTIKDGPNNQTSRPTWGTQSQLRDWIRSTSGPKSLYIFMPAGEPHMLRVWWAGSLWKTPGPQPIRALSHVQYAQRAAGPVKCDITSSAATPIRLRWCKLDEAVSYGSSSRL